MGCSVGWYHNTSLCEGKRRARQFVHNIHHNKICDTALRKIYAKVNAFFWQEKLDLTFCLTLWHLSLSIVIRGREPEGVVAGHHGVPGYVGGVDAVVWGDVRVAWWSYVVILTADAHSHQSLILLILVPGKFS